MSGILQSISSTLDGSPLLRSINTALENQPVLSFLNNHRISTACVSAALLYGAWYLKRPRNLPPGPWGYPLVGSAISLEKTPDLGFHKLAKKHGDIFCLWMGGNKYWVILASYEAIREAYVTRKADFMDRDSRAIQQLMGMEDTIFMAQYDDSYRNSRKVGGQSLRTLITTKLDDMLEVNVAELHKVIGASQGEPFDIFKDLRRTLANIISELLSSKRYQYGSQDLDAFIEKIDAWYACMGESYVIAYVPMLMSRLFMSKQIAGCQKATRDIVDIFRTHIDEHQETFDEGNIRDIIDAFLLDKNQFSFTTNQIANNMVLLLPDASTTVYEVTLWVIIYLVNHPECQEQIHSEIQAVLGSGKISVKDRSRMPVTESFIMETLRLVSSDLFGMENKPVRDTTFRGYNMPRCIGISPFYGSVHRDPRFFPKPEEFQPGRFIEDGQIGNTEHFMPFGVGRRMCMGEPLARAEMFYLVASLVKQYKIRSPDGAPLSTEMADSAVSRAPKKFSAVFEKR